MVEIMIQVIKVYKLEAPDDMNESDAIEWAENLTSLEIAKIGSLKDVTTDYAEIC